MILKSFLIPVSFTFALYAIYHTKTDINRQNKNRPFLADKPTLRRLPEFCRFFSKTDASYTPPEFRVSSRLELGWTSLELAIEDTDNIPTNLESNLTSLSITGGLFTQIKNLAHLTNLRSLSITNCPLVEVDGLDHNYNLRTLLLDSNSVRAIKKKNIGHLTNLQYLSLNDALVSNLWTTVDALKPLINLRQLTFDSSQSSLQSVSAEDFNDEEGQSEQNNEESLMSDLSEIENMLEEGSNSDMDQEGSGEEDEGSLSELTRWMQRAWDYGLIHKQRYYREFMIHHLPQLEVLDEKIISAQEREHSSEIVAKHFIVNPFTEYTKNSKKSRNMPELLVDWQLGTVSSRSMATRTYRKHYAQYAQPKLTRLCERYKPRQVEYNPTLPGLMLFGTINSEIGVVNYEKKKVLGLTSVEGNSSTVLGLCWLRSNPFRFVAGCDSGHINMFDVNDLIANKKGALHQYPRFPRLTSISVNAMDELLLTSGYSRNVFVHDLNTSREVRTYHDCHNNYINSAKFANSVPYLFTTSSFDHSLKLFDIRDRSPHPIYTRETKNECLMVTWSPDDRYLLLSCADNEVTQFNAVDGSVNLAYPLKPINSEYNYTRSYYINHGQYIIVGSCEQAAIRICSTKDGRLLREVNFDNDAGTLRLCCQSLRGNPHEDFRFSILVAEVLNYSDLKLYDVDLLHCE